MTEADLRAGLEQAGLSTVAEWVVDQARPALRLRATPRSDAHIPVGASKFGGLPDLPLTVPWPTWHGMPQGFIAQVNLAEAGPYLPPGLLPSTGILLFFYDRVAQPWGYDPLHGGCAQVLYVSADDAPLQRRPAPLAVDAAPRCAPDLRTCAVSYSSVLSVPAGHSAWFAQLVRDEDVLHRYWDWVGDFTADRYPSHQLLGWPRPVQNDEMELECQLVSHGVIVDSWSTLRDPRHAHLHAGAPEWHLLLQVDSDPALDTAWVDDGRIFYWIRRQDLVARSFGQTWLMLECD